MVPPLALDIDGTLTTPTGALDPRVFSVVPAWEAPVVLATGKSFPYPVALCHYLDVPPLVVAENGGVVCTGEEVRYQGNRDQADAATREFRDRGGDLGWGPLDFTNRWRETEVAAAIDADEALLREVAAEYGLEVVDTGYAYHVKTPGVEKGDGLREVATALGRDADAFVAVGDSENDASTFRVAGRSFAVANADETAAEAADEVTDAGFMTGTIEALRTVDPSFDPSG
jgi:hypothetical protein